jgi:hypothetical protein
MIHILTRLAHIEERFRSDFEAFYPHDSSPRTIIYVLERMRVSYLGPLSEYEHIAQEIAELPVDERHVASERIVALWTRIDNVLGHALLAEQD